MHWNSRRGLRFATRARQLSSRNRRPANMLTNEASTHDQRVLAAIARDRRGTGAALIGLLRGRRELRVLLFNY
jgi:hypothetical protein